MNVIAAIFGRELDGLTCRYSKVTLPLKCRFYKTEIIGGKNLKNAGLPKVSDNYGSGVSIVVKNEVRQLVFEHSYCTQQGGANMLVQIEKRDFDTLHNVYSLFSDINLLYSVYHEIRSKPGNMTPGSDGKTIDGIDEKFFEKLRKEIISEKYKPRPTKRIYIPKSQEEDNGKTRPLGIPTIKDKIIQHILKKLLEAIYEKEFSTLSHGYRPQKGTHTVARNLRKWYGIS